MNGYAVGVAIFWLAGGHTTLLILGIFFIWMEVDLFILYGEVNVDGMTEWMAIL
jgi:hypothetical protein